MHYTKEILSTLVPIPLGTPLKFYQSGVAETRLLEDVNARSNGAYAETCFGTSGPSHPLGYLDVQEQSDDA